MFLELIKLVRVKQWVKNLFVFAPLIFDGKFTDPDAFLATTLAFISFCLLSSVVYIVNDIFDRAGDRQHPLKNKRPLASGAISLNSAWLLAFLLLCGVCLTLFFQPLPTTMVLLLYLFLNLLYTVFCKHLVIIDVLIIATGFVLRVVAGACAIGASVSTWMFLVTFFLSLFIGFGKRRYELYLMDGLEGEFRAVLHKYSTTFCDALVTVCLGLTIITYSLYTVDPQVIARLQSDKLIYSLPMVIYGLFRYLYLLYEKHDGELTEVLFRDRGLQMAILLWLVFVFGLIYSTAVFA